MPYAVRAMSLIEYPPEHSNRNLFLRLDASEYAAIEDVVRFESDVLGELGRRQKATLSRVVRAALKLFVAQHWEVVGGRPVTADEWRATVERVARKTRASEAQRSKKRPTSKD